MKSTRVTFGRPPSDDIDEAQAVIVNAHKAKPARAKKAASQQVMNHSEPTEQKAAEAPAQPPQAEAA